MHIIRQIAALPNDFDQFLVELTRGYADIYGQDAAAHYQSRAQTALNQILTMPGAAGYAAYMGKHCVGLCIGSRHGEHARVDFLHIQEGHEEQGIEQDLIRRLVDALDTGAPEWISMEMIPLCPLQLDDTMASLGFRSLERALMTKTLSDSDDAPGESHTQPLNDPVDAEIARLLHAAFARETAELPTPGFATIEDTQLLLRNYAAGEYGPYRPGWIRVTRDDDAITGVILGSAQSVDTGFVFQVAVVPEHQRQGVGTRLMQDLEHEFHRIGMRRVMLGVTTASPARQWYESIGYKLLRPVTVYYRHRTWIPKRF